MALVNCPECGNQVSDKAANCPSCGMPFQQVNTSSSPISRVPTQPKPKQRNWLRVALFCVLGYLLIANVLIRFYGREQPVENVKWSPAIPRRPEQLITPTEQVETSLVGDRIGDAPNKVALVAVDEGTLRSMMEKLVQRDVNGVLRYVAVDKATLLREGTKVRVISRKTLPGTSAVVVQIQVLEGDLEGRRVWTSSFFLP